MKNKKSYNFTKARAEHDVYVLVSSYGLVWVILNAVKSKVDQSVKKIKKLITE